MRSSCGTFPYKLHKQHDKLLLHEKSAIGKGFNNQINAYDVDIIIRTNLELILFI